MKNVRLGASNLRVSRIALGTMAFGPRTSEEEAHRILDAAVDIGITLIDTSCDYGAPNWGQTEAIIGSWLANDPAKRDRIVLATKVYQTKPSPLTPNEEAGFSRYKVRRQVEESLRRLQTDHIDLYQIHHFDRTVREEELWSSFENLTVQGKISYAGSSNYAAWALVKHQVAARSRGNLGFVSEQTMYNLWCRYPELELLPAARDMGVGVLAYMPLAGGLLTGTTAVPGSRTAQVSLEYRIDPVVYDNATETLRVISGDMNISPSTLATAWTLDHPAVSAAVVGVRTADHMKELELAASVLLKDEHRRLLDEAFAMSSGKVLKTAPAPEAYAW